MVLEKTLDSPLDSKEIKAINPKGYEYSLEGLLLKLKLQYFGWAPKSLQMVTAAMKLKDTYSMEGKL